MGAKVSGKRRGSGEAAGDIARLKILARALLGKIEQVLEGDKGVLEAETYQRLFGTRASLIYGLVTVSDLLLRLHEEDGGAEAEDAPGGFSEADAALVDAFVRRMRQPETV